jgi:hypothetical protein
MKLLVSLCLLALPLSAQDARALLPKDPVVYLRITGGQELARQFEGTPWHKFGASPALAEALAPLRKQLDQALAEGAKETGIDLKPAWDEIAAHARDLTFVFDIEDVADVEDPDDLVKKPMFFALLLRGGQDADFGKLAEQIGKTVEQHLAEQLHDLKVEGRTLRVLQPEDDAPGFALPFVFGKDLVLAAGNPADDKLRAFLSGSLRPAPAATAARPDAVLEFRLDGKKISDLLLVAMQADADGEPETTFVREFFRLFSLDQLGPIAATVQREGGMAAIDLSLDLRGDATGLLAMLAGERKAPALLDVVPRNAVSFGTGTFRFGELYRQIMGLMDRIGEAAEGFPIPSSQEIESQFSEQFKLRLREDLIDQLGDDFLYLEQASENLGANDEEALGSICLGIGTKNGAALAQSLDKLLRGAGMHAGRKTDEYQGVKVHRVPLMGFLTLHYAVTDRVALLAFADGGAKLLRAVIAEEKSRAAGQAAGRFPDGIQKRLDALGPGWPFVSGVQLTTMYETMFSGLLEQDVLEDEMRPAIESLVKVLRVMKDQHIDAQVQVLRVEPRRVVCRTLW